MQFQCKAEEWYIVFDWTMLDAGYGTFLFCVTHIRGHLIGIWRRAGKYVQCKAVTEFLYHVAFSYNTGDIFKIPLQIISGVLNYAADF